MKKAQFDYGYFEYAEMDQDFSYVKGKFHLNNKPKFYHDFGYEFILYNFDHFDKIIENNKEENYPFSNRILNLGPFYPKTYFSEDVSQNKGLKCPNYSKMLLRTKSHYIHDAKIRNNIYSYEGRIEMLRIFSNLFSTVISQNIQLENHISFIIPVPAKSIYSLNSISIICEELSAKLKIPIDHHILERITDETKEFRVIKTFDWREEISVILVDDMITDGRTKLNIINKLQKSNIKVDLIITLGKTDYNKISLI